MSTSEIQAIYDAGSAGKCTGPVPPQVIMQPLNQTTVGGSNVVLSVTASGTGPFSYQWNFNGKKISDGVAADLIADYTTING